MYTPLFYTLLLFSLFKTGISDNVRISTPSKTLKEAPEEFPKAKDGMKTVNFTFVANCSETIDMMKKEERKEEFQKIKDSFPDPINYTGSPKDDAELIENGENTEDKRVFKMAEKRGDRGGDEQDGDFHGQLAVILAISMIALTAACYTALIMWRRYLEARYGTREILVEEDELNDPNDMRHFTI